MFSDRSQQDLSDGTKLIRSRQALSDGTKLIRFYIKNDNSIVKQGVYICLKKSNKTLKIDLNQFYRLIVFKRNFFSKF
uniref:Uncharacterized protein n=1 Tax=Romanomermis culicivorax TaxID=13658 RepID=A0A915JD11_ROMCU